MHDQVPVVKATCTQIANEITASVTNYTASVTNYYTKNMTSLTVTSCTHITLNEQGIY